MPPNVSILEVGTGTGELGRRIRSRCRFLVGIEKDPEAVLEAEPYYSRIIQDDVCSALPAFREKFDLIILADILEHLENPGLVLRQVLPLLEKDGRIFISIPNIANIWVRIGLVFGRFDYSERGILDRTHLRFFTLKTLQEMLGTSGFCPLRIVASTIPVEIGLPGLKKFPGWFLVRKTADGLAHLLPTLFGYQFICEAVPSESKPPL